MNELNGQDWENLFPIRPNLGVSADIGLISEISGVFFFCISSFPLGTRHIKRVTVYMNVSEVGLWASLSSRCLYIVQGGDITP